ncbi:MAG TPA: TIGR03435 family protein [Acidobacteriaceae bacterium]
MEGKDNPSPQPVVSKIPAWDVISIKLDKSDGNMSMFRSIPDGVRLENITVKMLVGNSYGIRGDLISGLPSWAEKEHFDIDAKVSSEDVAAMKDLTREQRRQMMLAILNDRFHWRGHLETKELPIYELVVAKGGPKVKDAAPNNDPNAPKGPDGRSQPRGMVMMRPGELNARGAEMGGIAGALAGQVQRNIVDKTGLTGHYDLTLQWTPEQQTAIAGHDNGADQGDGASLFTALQEQLGLKLQSARGPVDTLVADHIEMPAEN